jgi:hypothetical protein
MVAANRLQRRCTACRFVQAEQLPPLDKKVIYLDQLALSEMFKLEMGRRRQDAPHEQLWTDLSGCVRRLVLLQQAVFPESDIHSNETTVFKHARELRDAYRRINGEVTFLDTETVRRKQVWAFADAYIGTGKPPAIDFPVDSVLLRDRNAWLPAITIHTNLDLSQFADGIRADRAKVAEGMTRIAGRWAKEKPSFDQALKEELEAYGRDHKQAFVEAMRRGLAGYGAGDFQAVINASMHPVMLQHMDMVEKFRRIGFTQQEASSLVPDFWDWPPLQRLPVHRISAHLYAAMARKVAAGQKRPPSQGMLNDVTAIATYAPYVDAMFVDNECAALLREAPLPQALKLKARIFSLNTGADFLAYLRGLDVGTPDDVRHWAEHIYGLKPCAA